jgi:hypothetical protein
MLKREHAKAGATLDEVTPAPLAPPPHANDAAGRCPQLVRLADGGGGGGGGGGRSGGEADGDGVLVASPEPAGAAAAASGRRGAGDVTHAQVTGTPTAL